MICLQTYLRWVRGLTSLVGQSKRGKMSDYNRNVTTSPFSQAAGRTSAAVDEGLRTYLLHVYNYMMLGLADHRVGRTRYLHDLGDRRRQRGG